MDATLLAQAGILEQRRGRDRNIVRVTPRFMAAAQRTPAAPLRDRIEAALRIWHAPVPAVTETAHDLALFLQDRDQAGTLA